MSEMMTAPICSQCWKLEHIRVPLVAVGQDRYRHAEHVRRARGCGVFEFRGGVPTQPKPAAEAPAA